MTGAGDRPTRARVGYGLAAVAAGIVAAIFGTVGDGVGSEGLDGPRKVLVEHGHTVVWLLLTVAFAAAARTARWNRLSQLSAGAAGLLYLSFLAAVFSGR